MLAPADQTPDKKREEISRSDSTVTKGSISTIASSSMAERKESFMSQSSRMNLKEIPQTSTFVDKVKSCSNFTLKNKLAVLPPKRKTMQPIRSPFTVFVKPDVPKATKQERLDLKLALRRAR